MMARNGEKVLGFMSIMIKDSPSIAFSDSCHAVAVVPRSAPMIRPIAFPSSMIPELTRPTERTVMAEADCTAAVTSVPNMNAKNRFFVMDPITRFRVPSARDVSESLSISIPVRNRASHPNIVAIIIKISTDDM